MFSLHLSQALFHLSYTVTLSITELTIKQGECWAFLGKNGSGKSSLGRAIAGDLVLLAGEYQNSFPTRALLSLEELQRLLTEEWQWRNTDFVPAEQEESGHTTADIIQRQRTDSELCQQLAQQFAITHLLDQPFFSLSTGEGRKALLCQALITQPDLLILDEPFDGLDHVSRQQLSAALHQLVMQGLTLIMIVNRLEEIPSFTQQIGYMEQRTLRQSGPYRSMLKTVADMPAPIPDALSELPERDAAQSSPALPAETPLITLRHGEVIYQNRKIISGLDWQVLSGQHWHILGPNGAGKSTLLSLVTGDHPQGYCNDLTLFGRRRGSGETIWQIKHHIGYVSHSLHLDYRVHVSVRQVILSGFYDTIGLYQAVTDRQQQLTDQWLSLLGFTKEQGNQPFQSLSWGQQRLLLIVRAMVKHPLLLILDEPLQGLEPGCRQQVKSWIDWLISQGNTQLLFVSHYAEDAPRCITHRLTFIAQEEAEGYHYQQHIVAVE